MPTFTLIAAWLAVVAALWAMDAYHQSKCHPMPKFTEVMELLPAREEAITHTLGEGAKDTINLMEMLDFTTNHQGYISLTRAGEDYFTKNSN